jgi:hypothetical protein
VMKKWKNFHFESSSIVTNEFISFVKDLKKYIRKELPHGSELVNWSVGHFYVSGFIKQGKKYVYFIIGDVRFGDWFSGVLVRTATGPKDYTGGVNNFVNLDFFHQAVNNLLNASDTTVYFKKGGLHESYGNCTKN